MIQIEMTGNLPTLNADLEPAMEKIADIMFRSVQENFIVGGRPNLWEPLQPFGLPSHLMQTGRMFESIQLQWGSTSATVFIDTSRVPYAAIHNFGGVIKHPGSSKFQAFEYGGGTVFTHYTKPHDIPIPKRQFMMFQDQDREQILQTLSNAIFFQS
jgi:phage gpG-like protein